jgi:hypothetical protein
MRVFILTLAAAVILAIPAMAGSNTDIAIVSPSGSDANNCVWKTPFTPPAPPACATGTHAAALLKGPGSALEFMSGTYNEMVAIHINKTNWSSPGGAFRIGRFPGATVMFDGGGFVVTGDGYMSLRGIEMKNCPGNCITAAGTSQADPLHGNIENENTYSSRDHSVYMVNTNGFELGYNFFENSDESHLFVSNSPNYNIHETSTIMNIKKTPQLGANIINSPVGTFVTHTDNYTGPTALSAVSSPHLSSPIVITPRKGNVCPASDVATDTFSSSWTAITSIGCP